MRTTEIHTIYLHKLPLANDTPYNQELIEFARLLTLPQVENCLLTLNALGIIDINPLYCTSYIKFLDTPGKYLVKDRKGNTVPVEVTGQNRKWKVTSPDHGEIIEGQVPLVAIQTPWQEFFASNKAA